MQVSRLEDGFAVRLPDSVVEELGLKEGDEVGVYRLPASAAERKREEALSIIRSLQWELPPGFKWTTSPGGTTAAGLRELEQSGLRAAVAAAVRAAKSRSEQLGVTYE